MKSKRNLSIALLLLGLAVAGLSVWDIYLATDDVPDNTISELVHGWSLDWYLLPAAFGVLMGHFFWPTQYREGWGVVETLSSLFIYLTPVAVVDLWWEPGWAALIPVAFAYGFMGGHWLWLNSGRDGT